MFVYTIISDNQSIKHLCSRKKVPWNSCLGCGGHIGCLNECIPLLLDIWFLRFGTAFSCQPWSLSACRSAAGRCQASLGSWFWVGRDVLGVPPFQNRLTLHDLPALSCSNVGHDQIAAFTCPSRLCLFQGIRTVHTRLNC